MTLDGSPMIFDSYAWVEYALGTAKAGKVAEYLDGEEEVYTPASVLAELREAMLRHGIKENTATDIMTYIRSRTVVLSIDPNLAELAGVVNFRNKKKIKGWGMLDSFVYAAAMAKSGRVLTGDPHFKGLPNVVLL
jgi:predicted nucleic acid-binding protein